MIYYNRGLALLGRNFTFVISNGVFQWNFTFGISLLRFLAFPNGIS